MTLFFNIELLEQKTNCDPEYMIKALNHWFNKRIVPKNIKQKYKPLNVSLSGFSYLLNPVDFFSDKLTEIFWRAQYLRLAGRRDYTLYKNFGIKYLDLSFLPEINKQAIQSNKLLFIQNNKVYFKYEEYK